MWGYRRIPASVSFAKPSRYSRETVVVRTNYWMAFWKGSWYMGRALYLYPRNISWNG
jgi:hypothetical protein